MPELFLEINFNKILTDLIVRLLLFFIAISPKPISEFHNRYISQKWQFIQKLQGLRLSVI